MPSDTKIASCYRVNSKYAETEHTATVNLFDTWSYAVCFTANSDGSTKITV